MTKLTAESSPILRETGVLYKGRQVVLAIFHDCVQYRLKGTHSPIGELHHLVGIEVVYKMLAKEKEGKW